MQEHEHPVAAGAQRPLTGIRVIDISTYIAGPFGSDVLGYLGADVIRVDPPPAAPPMPPRRKGEPVSEADGRIWALQRNKRSICLDLKKDDGRIVFYDLVRKTDIVFDNLRPGVLERLRIDYETLKAINPRIICCSVTGFGSEGPWAKVAAYDIAVQALSGAMAFTGNGDGIPCRWGVPVGDITASLYAVMGVFAALEDRDRTGRGQRLDISMLDCQLALHSFRVPQTFASGIEFSAPSPRRGGAGAVPYGPFACGDGAWVVIGVASNFWRPFCKAIGAPELADDGRFRSLELRQKNQAELDALLETHFLRDSAGSWEERLMASGVPVGKVRTIREAFEQPQAVARQMSVTFVAPGGQEVRAAASPIRFDGEDAFPHTPPSSRGADTERVLAELLHYSPERLRDLRAAGAIDAGAA